ncbi:hypothetical protein EV2_018931 [Malus domestica]
MKSDKVDYAAKVAPRLTLLTAEIDSPAEKVEITRVGSFEKSIKPISREIARRLLAYAKVVCPKDTKAAKEVVKTMVTEAYSFTEKIKRLKSELVALKGSNTSTPTSWQLETTSQEIIDLKTRLDAIQVKYESVETEI